MLRITKCKAIIGAGAAATVGALSFGYITPEIIATRLSDASQSQIARDLFLFSVAAWIHSGRVKKEFKSLTRAVEDLGSALRADLGKVWDELHKTNSRVKALETNKGEE